MRILILIAIIPFFTFSQEKKSYKSYNFHPPMEIPLILAGNFAELRSNHFHTGIDIKTQGVEGQKLFSIDDGYVSRIKISPWGYGKVIYIDHYNGFTSVYAHCQKLSEKFDSLMFALMTEKKVNELDAYFEKDEFKVKKGELIAISGNTGGSVAPHLHFEIRETKSEKPLNPLLFNFKIQDTRKPEIRGVKIYSLTADNYIIPGKSEYMRTNGAPPNYGLEEHIHIDESNFVAQGKIGLALDVIDRLNGANNVCGIYKSTVNCNGTQLYGFDFTKLDFGKNRMINGHTDVYEFKENRRDIHKLFSNPVTTLENYSGKTNGIPLISLLDTNNIEIIAKDQNSNKSVFKTKLVYQKNAPMKFDWSNYLIPHEIYSIRNENFEIFIPPGTIFEPIKKDFEVRKGIWTDGNMYHFGAYKTPVNNKVRVRISVKGVAQSEKLVICRANFEDQNYYSLGGKVEGDWIETKSKGLGDFFIKLDTVAPLITELNFREGQLVRSSTDLRVKLEDNLSGIKKYEVLVNGKFIPCYFSPRRSFITIPSNKISTKGDFELKIRLEDGVGNKVEKKFNLKK